MSKLTGRGERRRRPSAHVPERPRGARCLLVRNLGQLKALADPLRLRVLRAFAGEPRTAKQVAEEIGERPGRLYHHLAVLESVGLLEVTHTRQVRGTVEKHYRAVASRFEVDGTLFSAAAPAAASDAERVEMATSLLAQTRSEYVESLGRRRISDAGPKPTLARAVLSGTPEQIDSLVRRIQSLVSECGPGSEGGCPADAAGLYVLTLVGYELPGSPRGTGSSAPAS